MTVKRGFNVTKLVYFELQEVISDSAKQRQTATYSLLALLWQGNDVVTNFVLPLSIGGLDRLKNKPNKRLYPHISSRLSSFGCCSLFYQIFIF